VAPCAAAAPQVREFVNSIGVENIGKRLINSTKGKVSTCSAC
jgi:hypothetical protein